MTPSSLLSAVKERLTAIKARCDAASPGPWNLYSGPLRPNFPTLVHEITDKDYRKVIAWTGFDEVDTGKRETKANARMVAAAPADLAALVGWALEMVAGCEADLAGAVRAPEWTRAAAQARLESLARALGVGEEG